MNDIMMWGGVLITLALVFYSIWVWSERLAGRLKGWHLIFFWGGMVFDSTGTGIMLEVAGGIGWDIHGVSGVLAIVLMAVHAIWASVVLWRRDERAISFTISASLSGWSGWCRI
jgi:uncharacterized repeat protein (TIGR03987 family)